MFVSHLECPKCSASYEPEQRNQLCRCGSPLLEAVYKTNGCAVAISDEDTLKAEALMASVEGAFVCPEGAACMAAAQRLLSEGWIKPDERAVLLNTGCGIKYPETVQCDPPLLQPGDALTVC